MPVPPPEPEGAGGGGGGLTLAEIKTGLSAGGDDPLFFITSARRVTNGVTVNGDTTFTSSSANFTADDVGSYIVGANIPQFATIASINSETSVEMSAAATDSATGVETSITEPDPGAVGPGAVWVEWISTLDLGFGSLYYALHVRAEDNGSWMTPTLVGSDGAGRITEIVNLTGSGLVEVLVLSGEGKRRALVGINGASAYLDSYAANGGDITGEVVVANEQAYVRATTVDGSQDVRASATGVAVTTSGAGIFTYNGTEVAVVS